MYLGNCFCLLGEWSGFLITFSNSSLAEPVLDILFYMLLCKQHTGWVGGFQVPSLKTAVENAQNWQEGKDQWVRPQFALLSSFYLKDKYRSLHDLALE